MSSISNSCRFVGTVGRQPDVELVFLPSGLAKLRLGLAINDRKKVNEEWVDNTVWADVIFFGKSAENFARLVNKCDLVMVDSHYNKSQWETQEGEKRYNHDFVVDQWRILRHKGGADQDESESSEEELNLEPAEDDDLPF
jgi:single-strand DNA-binding protein